METLFQELKRYVGWSEADGLSTILEEFLQFARPRELDRSAVELPALIDQLGQLLRPQADAARVTLEVGADELPVLQADEARLKQALMNLTLNAIQATPAGGRVWLRAAADAAGVRVTVEDTGPGIAPELRERVFEPFFTTKEAGSGLGLPQVHSVVQQHGGSLWIEEREGGGARFVLTLPA